LHQPHHLPKEVLVSGYAYFIVFSYDSRLHKKFKFIQKTSPS
jgi:hypothetical protein